MCMITQKTINEVKEIPIISVAEALGMQVKGKKTKSPFTNEQTPSFHFYEKTNTFKDFSSEESGDTIALYRAVKKVDFNEAVKGLCEDFKKPFEVTEDSTQEKAIKQEAENLYNINKTASDYFAQKLNASPGEQYLKNRAITPEACQYFNIGFCDGTLPTVLNSGYSQQTIKDSQLLNEKGNSRFYKRIIFPIRNKYGKVSGFTARSITPEDKAKYLNTTETDIFKKSNLLYGLYENDKAIKKEKAVYLVEGITDAIALWQNDVKNVVSLLGKELSEAHVKQLQKYPGLTINLWLDSDEAGANAILRSVIELLKAGFAVNVIIPDLESGKDPDEYFKNGNKGLPKSKDAVKYFAELHFEKAGSDTREKVIAGKSTAELIGYLPGEFQQQYIKDINKEFGANIRSTTSRKDTSPDTHSHPDLNQYIRVGTNYFKWVVIKNAKTGGAELILEKWSPEIIKQDYGKIYANFIDKIPAFDTFCVRPSFPKVEPYFIDKDQISGRQSRNFNLVKPLTYEPKDGQFNTIKNFLTHIFGTEKSSFDTEKTGDPLTMIIDCFRIKFQKPTHLLPVVCLLSKEQETGKSTFFEFVCDVFSSNAVIITKEHLASGFNTTYADKLAICAEEIKINAKQDADLKNKLKHLATASKIFYNPKGVSQKEIEYFGWLMMSSNHEHDFLQLESDDKRFWITKLKTIEKKDPNLRAKMVAEVPAFAYYLLNTAIFHPQESRIWFAPQYIENEHRSHVIHHTRTALEKAITDAVTNIFLSFLVTEERSKENNIQVSFKCDLTTLTDVVNSHSRFKHDATQIKDWLANIKGIKPAEVARFSLPTGYDGDGGISYRNGKGRVMNFVYFDWVDEKDLNTLPMQEIHQQLKKELGEVVPF